MDSKKTEEVSGTAAMAVEETDDDDAAGYLDVDMVDLFDEDFQIMTNIRKLSDTAHDKLVFTVFMVNIMMSLFLAGFVPQYYYIMYTIKAVLLIGYRWYSYKKQKFHYFLFDFCYFTNFLVLFYLWFPFFDVVRAVLFPIIFCFCNGPLLAAVVLWRNSIVPHSNDKMTSTFIHVSPVVALWGVKWYSTDEQGFPLCVNPTASSPHCDHVDTWELIVYPMLVYLLWQSGYIAVIYFWRKERIQKRNYETSYRWIVERAEKGFIYRLFCAFAPRYRKLLFVGYQFVYTMASLLLAYPCYHYRYASVILVLITLVVASYNGATFYIDIFSHKYQSNRQKEK